MKLVAPGIHHLRGFPPNVINVYLVEDVLIDSGTRLAARRVLRQLDGSGVSAHALTHAHSDHFGSSKRVCDELGIPLWCGAEDVRTVETGELPRAPHQPGWTGRIPVPPTRGVDRPLREGDEVAGFQVLDVPGHSPGHVAYWRESDRALVLGDVLFNLHPVTGLPGLREPPAALTYDPVLNRESARKVALLEPALVLFGHGPPLRDTRKFVDFVGRLSD
jgi:hydroxyacylglutathione hydrolase